MGKRLTKEEFIIKSNEIHNNKYDYSSVNYINGRTKVKIICPEHEEFEQTPKSHLRKRGCSKCANNYNYTTTEFIEKISFVHNNKYDYSLVNYINSESYIKIICPEHGIFKQKSSNHLKGSGCNDCFLISRKTKQTDLIEKVSSIHNNKYDYSLVYYKNSYTRIQIICPEHGIFKQFPYNHILGNGCRSCKGSKGEKLISTFLKDNNINYKTQKTFKECKNIKSLQFDFYLPDYNICVEFDGIQHFESSEWFGGEDAFTKRKLHDNIKNEYCLNNNIRLIRIRYDENIEEKLLFLKSFGDLD